MKHPEERLRRLIACSLLLMGVTAVSAEQDPYHPPAPHIRDGSFNQDPGSGKLKGRVLRVKRPLIMVKDLERSIRFYVDVVGLELYSVEPTYDRNPESLGYELFNIPPGSRKRGAMLNTSDEVRGVTLQEALDFDWEVGQRPRVFTVLFETDDLVGLRHRARAAGHSVVDPVLGEIPATDMAPRLRFMEFGVIDPDGHVMAFFPVL